MNDNNIYIENPILKELRSDNKNWEKWFNLNVVNRHLCQNSKSLEHIENHSSAILLMTEGEREPTWMLAHVWLADKEEVTDCAAEEIGEVMNEYCFSIKFCPFCGELLKNSE